MRSNCRASTSVLTFDTQTCSVSFVRPSHMERIIFQRVFNFVTHPAVVLQQSTVIICRFWGGFCALCSNRPSHSIVCSQRSSRLCVVPFTSDCRVSGEASESARLDEACWPAMKLQGFALREQLCHITLDSNPTRATVLRPLICVSVFCLASH